MALQKAKNLSISNDIEFYQRKNKQVTFEFDKEKISNDSKSGYNLNF